MQALVCEVVAGAHEVGNGDRRQEADDGHHDHDFNEGEAGFAGRIDLHTNFCLFCSVDGVNKQQAGYYYYRFVHLLPVATAAPRKQ